MALATLFVIVFLTVIVWRLVFTGLHRSLARETAAPELAFEADGQMFNRPR